MSKNLKNLALMLTAVALVTGGAMTAQAGGCGSSAKHADAKHADGKHADAKQAKAQMGCSDEAAKVAIFPLAEQAGFNTLTAAVKAAGLDQVLTNDGPFTVFAPTDEAFAKLPEGTVESLLANPEQLKKVLLYHVVNGNVMAEQVVTMNAAQTLNGAEVAINTAGGVMVGEANVIETDITASNGTVHVIDTVLIPENL